MSGHLTRRQVFACVARFAAFSAALYALSFLPGWDQILARYLQATAALAGVVLNCLHQHTQAVGADLSSPHFRVSVDSKCSAAELIAFFWAAVLAFPAPLRRKALGLALGTAALALLNVARIVTVFLVGASHLELTDLVHEELCPALLQTAALVLTIACVRWLPVMIGRFLALFGLLLTAGLCFPEIEGAAFRRLGALAFTSAEGEREVTFEHHGPRHTTVVIVNRTLMNPDGSGPVRNVDLDPFAYLWRPTLLVIALNLAAPIPWRRRLQAAALSLLGVWAYARGALSFAIWNESSEVTLVTLSPWWKSIANEAQATLVAQLGLTVPALACFLTAFPPTQTTTRVH